jgi:hypothetical protein
MCKKIGIVALAVVAGLFLLNKTNLGSYTRTAWNKIKCGAKDQVPLEFEIERVKNEISQLVPDMRDQLKLIAQETVAVENLRDDIKVTRNNLTEQKKRILAMKKDLESGAKTVKYNGTEVSASRVSESLARNWDLYKKAEKNLDTREKLLETRENGLAAAREQLSTIRATKEELELQVAQMELDLKTQRIAATKSTIQFDDSRLSRIKDSIASIRNRLRVNEVEQALEGQFGKDLDVPVEKKVQTTELLKDIDNHFGKDDAVVDAK